MRGTVACKIQDLTPLGRPRGSRDVVAAGGVVEWAAGTELHQVVLAGLQRSAERDDAVAGVEQFDVVVDVRAVVAAEDLADDYARGGREGKAPRSRRAMR